MKIALSGQEMASFDKYTIEEIGIPSLVLMERAALSCVEVIAKHFDDNSRIHVICGPGNNGADGVAIARILFSMGYENVSYSLIGNPDKYTNELISQINIAKKLSLKCIPSINKETLSEYDLIVDALFGIGLSRDPAGEFADIINSVNMSNAKVLSVDIPSGISADTGKGYEPHIMADYTVTFQYAKKGLLLSEGYLATGSLTIADIGIIAKDTNAIRCSIFDSFDIESLLPALPLNANKGSRGKVLIIAGSESIYGACYLSVKAALKAGSGLVRVYTHTNNIPVIQKEIPEAMYTSYEAFDEATLSPLVEWADSILIGPGLSTSDNGGEILTYILENVKCPLVIDADGINILSENINLLSESNNKNIVLTPHLKEMSRLVGLSVSEIQNNMEKTSLDFVKKYNCSIILKNFTSFIAGPDFSAINTSGNQSMATAGSGDVLAGITASLLAQGICMENALPIASFIHGKAGEKASESKGMRSVLASDIIDNISI